MSQKDKTREELLFELEQVKRADEDHFQSLLDDMEKIQAEMGRLEKENARLQGSHSRGDALLGSAATTASQPPAMGTRPESERTAPLKQAGGRHQGSKPPSNADAGTTSAEKKAIAERRLRELAASGFRKRARSAEQDEEAPSDHHCDRLGGRSRGSRSPTQPSSRERERPRIRDDDRDRERRRDRRRSRTRERELSHRDSSHYAERRSDRDRGDSRERGQRSERRRASRSPPARRQRSERASPQASPSPARPSGRDVLALPGPSQPPSSALTALGPLFADQLQSMVAPLAALGPALQGIVSMLQAVPAAISSMQAQMDERDAKMQQKLQQTKDKNEELQEELNQVKVKIKTGSEVIDKSARNVDKLKDQMTKVASKSAPDPKLKAELARLRKQVELVEKKQQQGSALPVPFQPWPQHSPAAATSVSAPKHVASGSSKGLVGSPGNQMVAPQLQSAAQSVSSPPQAACPVSFGSPQQSTPHDPSQNPFLKPLSPAPALPSPASSGLTAIPALVPASLQHPSQAAYPAHLLHLGPAPAQGTAQHSIQAAQQLKQKPSVPPSSRMVSPGWPPKASLSLSSTPVPSQAAPRSAAALSVPSVVQAARGPQRSVMPPSSAAAPVKASASSRSQEISPAQIVVKVTSKPRAPAHGRAAAALAAASQALSSAPNASKAAARTSAAGRGSEVATPSSAPADRAPSPAHEASKAAARAPAIAHPAAAASRSPAAVAARASIRQAPPPVQAAWEPTLPVYGPAVQTPHTGLPPVQAAYEPTLPVYGPWPPEQAAWDPNPIVLRPAPPEEAAWDPNSIMLRPAVQAPHPAIAKAAGPSPAVQVPQAAALQAQPGAVTLTDYGVASQQSAPRADPPSSAAKQKSASKGDADQNSSGKGSRVAVEVFSQRKRPLRDEALQAGQTSKTSPAKTPQETLATPTKRARTAPEEASRGAAQAFFSSQGIRWPVLDSDLICGICELSFGTDRAFLCHLIGEAHKSQLNNPANRTVRPPPGADRDSEVQGHFLASFPWGCRFCDRKFKLKPYLIDHCLNSKPHQAKLQQALKISFTAKQREEGELRDRQPWLSGVDLLQAWAAQSQKQTAAPEGEAGRGEPTGLRVVALNTTDAEPGSGLRRVAYQESSPDAKDRSGKGSETGTDAAGWLYGSPRHAAEAGRQPSREGSVEDGELPRVPVAFSLAPGKAATPQKAAPAASEAARPAGLPEKGSAAPASGTAAAASTSAAAGGSDTFLPPHLHSVKSPGSKAGPTLPRPAQQPALAHAASVAAPKAQLQHLSAAAAPARAAPLAQKASGAGKSLPSSQPAPVGPAPRSAGSGAAAAAKAKQPAPAAQARAPGASASSRSAPAASQADPPLMPPGILPASKSAAALAAQLASTGPVSAEAVAMADVFLESFNTSDNAFSAALSDARTQSATNQQQKRVPSPPDIKALRAAQSSAGRQTTAGHGSSAGSRPSPALADPAKTKASQSPEMQRLESLMQRLSDMKHKLPASAPAKPQGGPAPHRPTSRQTGLSGSDAPKAASTSASPAVGLPARVGVSAKLPDAASKPETAAGRAASQPRAEAEGDQEAARKLREEIAKLQQVIAQRELAQKKKAAAGAGAGGQKAAAEQAAKPAAVPRPPSSTRALLNNNAVPRLQQAAPSVAAGAGDMAARPASKDPAAAQRLPVEKTSLPGSASPQATPAVPQSAADRERPQAAVSAAKSQPAAASQQANALAQAPRTAGQQPPPASTPAPISRASTATSCEAGRAQAASAAPAGQSSVPRPAAVSSPAGAAKPAGTAKEAAQPAPAKECLTVQAQPPQSQATAVPCAELAPGTSTARAVQGAASAKAGATASQALPQEGAVPAKALHAVTVPDKSQEGKPQASQASPQTPVQQAVPASTSAAGKAALPHAPRRHEARAAPMPGEPGMTAKQGRMPGTAAIPGVPLPVLAMNIGKAVGSPTGSGATPAYTMLTLTPLGTGSAWPVTPQKPDKPAAPASGQPSRAGERPGSDHPEASSAVAPASGQHSRTPQPNTASARPKADSPGRLGLMLSRSPQPDAGSARPKADSARQVSGLKPSTVPKPVPTRPVQLPGASTPRVNTPASGGRPVRGRVMTTGRRPTQATLKKPMPPQKATAPKAPGNGIAPEKAIAKSGSSDSSMSISVGSPPGAGPVELPGGEAGGKSSGAAEVAPISGSRPGDMHAAQRYGESGDGREAQSAAQQRPSAVPGREDANGQQAAAAPQHRSDSQKQKPSEAKAGAAVSRSTGGPQSEVRQPQPEADVRQGSPTRSATRAGGNTDTASASGAVIPRAAAKPQRDLQQPGKADTGQAGTSLASTKAAAAQGMARPSTAKEPEKAGLKAQKEAGAAGEAASAGAGKPATAGSPTPAAAMQSSQGNRGSQVTHENSAAPKGGQTLPALQAQGGAAAAVKPANAVMASAPAKSVAAAHQGKADTKAAQASLQPAVHGALLKGALQSAPEAARAAAPPKASSAQQAQHGSAAPKVDQAPAHPSALSKQGQNRLSVAASHGTPAAAGTTVSAVAKSALRPGQTGQGAKSQASSRPADSSAQDKPVPSAASASRVPASLVDREKAGELKGGSIAGAPKSAGAAAQVKAPVQPAARTPIPAPMQAAPVSNASAEHIVGHAHQKEDTSAGKAAKVSRFAPVGYTPAAGGAPKVQISRPAAGGSGAGASARLQQGSAQPGSAQRAGIDARQDPHAKGHKQPPWVTAQQQSQGQSRRIVTVSHDSHDGGHAGSHMGSHVTASQPRYKYGGMPPLPAHLHGVPPQQQEHPLYAAPPQDPLPERHFLPQQHPGDPRYLPAQGQGQMDWFPSEAQGMGSLPHPWEMHERMHASLHMGRPGELQAQAQQLYAAPEAGLPSQPGERSQGVQHPHLPPHLPPMPMPPGDLLYSDRSQFPPHLYSNEGMRDPGLLPSFGGHDYGRPHSQGYDMYGNPEQPPFPPR